MLVADSSPRMERASHSLAGDAPWLRPTPRSRAAKGASQPNPSGWAPGRVFDSQGCKTVQALPGRDRILFRPDRAFDSLDLTTQAISLWLSRCGAGFRTSSIDPDTRLASWCVRTSPDLRKLAVESCCQASGAGAGGGCCGVAGACCPAPGAGCGAGAGGACMPLADPPGWTITGPAQPMQPWQPPMQP
jgi:hypothetical protein